MANVFICHRKADVTLAERLAQEIKAAGQVISQAPEAGHGRVGVRVDQARHDRSREGIPLQRVEITA